MLSNAVGIHYLHPKLLSLFTNDVFKKYKIPETFINTINQVNLHGGIRLLFLFCQSKEIKVELNSLILCDV